MTERILVEQLQAREDGPVSVSGWVETVRDQKRVQFVILREGITSIPDSFEQDLRNHVAVEISPIAKPREVNVVPELPKTRSGKIMRRLLKDVAEGRELGDTSTLVDPTVFENIRSRRR